MNTPDRPSGVCGTRIKAMTSKMDGADNDVYRRISMRI